MVRSFILNFVLPKARWIYKNLVAGWARFFAGLRVMLDIRLIFEARDVIKLPALIRVKYPIIYMKYIFGGINNEN